MIRRLVRDESGMTMGLTVIMIVLIGVMGAGLLTFVQNDLSSVIESNQGQTAFNLADAGTQAAKRHLLVDASAFNYDGNSATGTAPGGESPWSCKPDANNVCTGSGKTIDLGTGNSTKVWIQYLKPSLNADHLDDGDRASELVTSGTDYEFGRDFFRVISEGTAGNARRKVEAIYQTYDLGTPRAYFAQGNIALRGAANIDNISVFSLLNVTLEGSGDKVSGEDLAYGNWLNPPFNTRARGTTMAGIGAVGTITANRKIEAEDFDMNGSRTTTTPKFIRKTNPEGAQNNSTEITFPFNYQRQPDIEMMSNAAKMQSNGCGQTNYYEVTGPTANLEEACVGTGPKWPASSDISTVVFVRFTNAASINTNLLTWAVDHPSYPNDGCDAVEDDLATPAKGTLVVQNGNFKTGQNKLPLRGTVVVKGSAPNVGTNGTGLFSYEDTGGACMESFAHASGDMDIGGNPGAVTQERGNRPGFFGIRLWSWRECYSTTCT